MTSLFLALFTLFFVQQQRHNTFSDVLKPGGGSSGCSAGDCRHDDGGGSCSPRAAGSRTTLPSHLARGTGGILSLVAGPNVAGNRRKGIRQWTGDLVWHGTGGEENGYQRGAGDLMSPEHGEGGGGGLGDREGERSGKGWQIAR